MRKLIFLSLCAFCSIGLLYVILFWGGDANPSLPVLIAFLAAQFFCLGFIWGGNSRSVAMEPIGHIAGVGAAINGFVATVVSIPIATLIGSYVDTTVLPLFIGLAVCGSLSLFIFMSIKKTRTAALA